GRGRPGRGAEAGGGGAGTKINGGGPPTPLRGGTKRPGFPGPPPLKRTTIARVELVPLEEHRALAVLVTDSGWVTARPLSLEPPLPADEVRKLGRELTRRFGDRTVTEIIEMETTPADPLDALHTRAR